MGLRRPYVQESPKENLVLANTPSWTGKCSYEMCVVNTLLLILPYRWSRSHRADRRKCLHRRKYNRGRMIREQWVFGGIDTQTKAGFMVPVDRRDAATLLPIIQQFILPLTTIVSDLWGAYNTVGNLGYARLTVNHSVNFVDPLTFAHTNAVENFWMRSKFRSKKERGTSANLLPSYLQEFMWRQIFGGDSSEYRSGD